MDRFAACLPLTLAQECPFPNDWSNQKNFSNDPHDPGGKTFCGIIQTEYDAYRRKLGAPLRDVRQMTQAEGHDIYLNSYWLPHCPALPPGLDLQFFDEAVNTGVGEAIKVLQYVLLLEVDGKWGPKTDAAIKALKNTAAYVAAFTARRKAVYREMHGFSEFGRDWTRRAAEIGAAALKMAAEAASPAPTSPTPAAAPAPVAAPSSQASSSAKASAMNLTAILGLVSNIPQLLSMISTAYTAVTQIMTSPQASALEQTFDGALEAFKSHNTAGAANHPALSPQATPTPQAQQVAQAANAS
jgi:lysozyme family protein